MRYAAIALVTAPHFLVTRGAVQERFAALGFVDVAAELDTPPAGWPAGTLPPPSSGFYAYVQGTWGKPAQTVAMPSEIVAAWELAPAGPTTAWAPPKASGMNPISAMLFMGTSMEFLDDLWEDLFG